MLKRLLNLIDDVIGDQMRCYASDQEKLRMKKYPDGVGNAVEKDEEPAGLKEPVGFG